MRKRLFSLLLIFMMLFTSFPQVAGVAYADTQYEGSVFVSLSDDGKFVVSDGEIPDTPIAYLEVPLQDVAEVDLDSWDLGYYSYTDYNTGEPDPDAPTVLKLYLYLLEHYYGSAGDGVALTASGGVHSFFMNHFWGHDCNLLYYVNGTFPLYKPGWGATADGIIVNDGDFVDVAMFTDWGFYTDKNAGFNYFAESDSEPEDGAITHKYEVEAGQPLTVQVIRGMGNVQEGENTSYSAADDLCIHYGTEVDPDDDSDLYLEDGKAEITFDEPGTYYVWADGGIGETTGTPCSCAAVAKVTVNAVAPVNNPPVRKDGVSATDELEVEVGETINLNLSDIFTDTDEGDILTYKVSVNEADYVTAEENYSYTANEPGTVTLVFKANDGELDSEDTYTVTLTVTVPTYEVVEDATTSEFTIGSGEPVAFKSSGPFDKFDSFTFDGDTLAKDTDYTVSEGSTIVTLTEPFTNNNLAEGEHSWAMNYTNGAKTEGTMTVKGAPEDPGTDPCYYWDEAKDGNGWYAWSAGWMYVKKVYSEGVGVKSFTWDGTTCNIILVPTTKKDAQFTFKTENYARSGNIYIDGSNAGTSSSTTAVELVDGYKSITVQPRSGSRTGTTKTFNFSIEGGGIDATYNVNLPTSETFTVEAAGDSVSPVPSKGSYSFAVTISDGYKKGQNFAVKANGIELTADAGGIYTIENIREDQTVTVEDVVSADTLFYWNVTLPTGAGYTATAEEGSESPVAEGENYSFKIAISDGYAKNDQFAVKANGVELNPDANDVYSITNIDAHQVVTVDGVQDIYEVTLVSGDGYEVIAEGSSSSPVFSGDSFSFKVNIADGYKEGAYFAVKVNDVPLTADDQGIYTISDIREAKTVTVVDVVSADTVNKFDITHSAAAGSTIVPLEGYSSPVDEGNDYKFTVAIEDGYSKNASFAVKDNGVAVTPDSEGVYTISNIKDHHEITVSGLTQLASVIAPSGSTVTAGYESGAWTYNWYEPVQVVDNGDESNTYWFNPVTAGGAFFRVQHPDGVTYWNFESLASGKSYRVTMDDLTKNGSFSKDTIYHDFHYNYLDLGDVYLTANDRGYLPMNQGGTYRLDVFRNWCAINSFTNDKIALPDVHYEVEDINGNPSNLVTISTDEFNSGKATITAGDSTGTAVIKITYDAMIHMDHYASGYGAGGADTTRLGAIWPECTGILVVTVGEDGSAINMGMTINTDLPMAHAGKVAGDKIDAEHDLLYYYGEEGAEYTFKPEAGTTVSVARPTVGSRDLSFSGFSTDGITTDGDGNVTVTGLVAGRNIVKVEKDGLANYQVISARKITITAADEDGNEIGDWETRLFAPGDKLTLKIHNANSPQEKLQQCYNNSFTIAYFGEDNIRLPFNNDGAHGYGQYNFSSLDQVVTATIPADWTTKKTFTLKGGIALAGFSGTAAGGHRGKTFGGASGMAQGTAGAGILARLPELTLNVNVKPYIKDGVDHTKAEDVSKGDTYELNLSEVFTDSNPDDVLSYMVSIDGADPISADENYSFDVEEEKVYRLIFKANDGTEESDDAYTLILKAKTGNVPPIRKASVPSSTEATIGQYDTYEIDLNTIFEDVDENDLTFKVAIDGAEPVEVEGNYVFTPAAAGSAKLVFTANDGTDDSDDTYAVNLTILPGFDPGIYWDENKDGTGWYAQSPTSGSRISKVSSGGVRVQEFKWEGNQCDITLIPETTKDAKFDFIVANYVNNANYGVKINGTEYKGGTARATAVQTIPVTLVDGEATVTVQPYRSTTNGTLKTFNFKIPRTNTPPKRADGVDAASEVEGTFGEAFELDLSTIFTDEDDDTLTYKVKVGDADYVEAEKDYSFTPDSEGTFTFVFMANDGTADSEDTYTVTLTIDHVWGNPTYTWNDDNTKVTAERVCTNDPEHKDTKVSNVKVSYKEKPTATGSGTKLLTATFDEPYETQTKEVEAPAYGEVKVKINLLGQVDKNTLKKVLFDFEVSSEDAAKYGYEKPEAFWGKVTMSDAAAALHREIYGEDFENEPEKYLKISNAGTCSRIFGEPTYMNGFHLNDKTPEYPDQPGVGSLWNDTPLADGDNVRIFQVHGEMYGLSESYLMFDEGEYTAHEGEGVDVTVTGDLTFGSMMGMPEDVQPVEDVVVYAVKDFTNPEGTMVAEATTDEEGVASFSNLPAGEYHLVVYEYENGYGEDCFSTPYAKLTVSAHQWDDGEVTTAPTCSQKGEKTFKCTVEGCNVTKTEEVAIDSDAHVWGIPTYNWADDNSTCTATRVCELNNEHVETETVPPTRAFATVPTFETGGVKTLTATFENKAFEAQTKNIDTPNLGFTVMVDDEVIPQESIAIEPEGYDASYDMGGGFVVDSIVPLATVTVPCGTTKATIILNDVSETYCTYYYTAEPDDTGYTKFIGDTKWGTYDAERYMYVAVPGTEYDAEIVDGQVVRIQTEYDSKWNSDNLYAIAFEVEDHDWGETTYTWAEDNSTVTATRVCENDPEHTETEEAKTTSVTTDPTCIEKGKTTYTATFENEAFAEQTKEVEIEALGHTPGKAVKENEVAATCEKAGSYDEVVYCEVCKNELSRETKSVEALGHKWDEGKVTKPATELMEGEMTFTCQHDSSHTKTEAIPKLDHKHNMIKTAAKKATCMTNGNIEYYTCRSCNRIYKDAAGKTVIKYSDTVIEATGHKYGEWKVTKKATCTAAGTEERVCANDKSHKETRSLKAIGHKWDAGKVTKEPTRTAEGIRTFTCQHDSKHTKTEKIAKLGIRLERIYENNRYGTAHDIGSVLRKEKGGAKYKNVIIASGLNFPDALSGAYLAKVKGAPIVLADSGSEDSTVEFIRNNVIKGGQVYILGGEKAVPKSIERKLSGYWVKRLSGANRYDTNISILKEAGVKAEDILVCSGTDYPDALSASAVGKPILLVGNTLTPNQKAYLKTLKSKKYYIIGGTKAVVASAAKDVAVYGDKKPERVQGQSRFETSVKVAERFFKNPKAVVLAYAMNYPDGLTGAPLAIQLDGPIILADSNNANNKFAKEYVKKNAIARSITLGGVKLISDEATKDIMSSSSAVKRIK